MPFIRHADPSRKRPAPRPVCVPKVAEDRLRLWREQETARMGSLWGPEYVLTDEALRELAKDAAKYPDPGSLPVAASHRDLVWALLDPDPVKVLRKD